MVTNQDYKKFMRPSHHGSGSKPHFRDPESLFSESYPVQIIIQAREMIKDVRILKFSTSVSSKLHVCSNKDLDVVFLATAWIVLKELQCGPRLWLGDKNSG